MNDTVTHNDKEVEDENGKGTELNLTNKMEVWWLSLAVSALLLSILRMVSGHGRLVEPPSRSSMWRFGFNNTVNYNDNALFCGGKSIQWEVNNGKCGVCGDRFDGPRENEVGGKYAKGIIVRNYNPGETIKVTVHITANHKGWFEFRLCENNDPKSKVTQECMDRNLLFISEAQSTRWVLDFTNAFKKTLHVTLPTGLRCRACVLQWKYNTGNSWGVDPSGRGCVGCGPQEQFYGCADISIGYGDVVLGKPNVVPVSVPDGDVDERTWDGENTQEQTGNCYCPCSSAAVEKFKHQNSIQFLIVVIFINVFLCAK